MGANVRSYYKVRSIRSTLETDNTLIGIHYEKARAIRLFQTLIGLDLIEHIHSRKAEESSMSPIICISPRWHQVLKNLNRFFSDPKRRLTIQVSPKRFI